MKNFVNLVWNQIQKGKTAFSWVDFVNFQDNFGEMLENYWKQYSYSDSGGRQFVAENRALFEKLADILLVNADFFSVRFIREWLYFIYETGQMPRAGDFIVGLKWRKEAVAPYVIFYVDDAKVRYWIAQNWDICHKNRVKILWALHEKHIHDYDLFKIYNPHFLRSFLLFLMFSAVLGFVYFEYAKHPLLLVAEVFCLYWILLEFYFALLCRNWRAFGW